MTWAHPEFGQVLATCSFDRTVAVWEEQGIGLLLQEGLARGINFAAIFKPIINLVNA